MDSCGKGTRTPNLVRSFILSNSIPYTGLQACSSSTEEVPAPEGGVLSYDRSRKGPHNKYEHKNQ